MSNPYIGEIRMFGGNFAPAGWAFCNGQLIAISENETLFQLIGTTYGGDGQETFALPDLQSRVPVHQGQGAGLSNYTMGEKAGAESVTLTTQQMPIHTHPPLAGTNQGDQSTPASNYWAAGNATLFSDQTPAAAMNQGTILAAGGTQPHDNMLPYLAISFIISLFGVFPSQN